MEKMKRHCQAEAVLSSPGEQFDILIRYFVLDIREKTMEQPTSSQIIAESDAQAARLQESLMFDDDASVVNTESDEDDEQTALESAFHNMRIGRVATFRHFRCCPSCAEEVCEYVEELEEVYDGWVFFTIADTEAAITTGWLTLRFGCNSVEYDIGRRVCDGHEAASAVASTA